MGRPRKISLTVANTLAENFYPLHTGSYINMSENLENFPVNLAAIAAKNTESFKESLFGKHIAEQHELNLGLPKSSEPEGSKIEVTSPSTSEPPTLLKRNTHGLIYNNKITYFYNPDGSVNWRAMINPDFVVVNKKKSSETDISKVEERDLIIKLGAMKELAFIRGFESVEYIPVYVDPTHVAVRCRINWIANYETQGRRVSFEAMADATHLNSDGFGGCFLATNAENRAFARCVRNFLRINIVSEEEYADVKLPEKLDNTDPAFMLKKLMTEKNVELSQIKNILAGDGFEKIEQINSVTDIPKLKIFELIERLQKA